MLYVLAHMHIIVCLSVCTVVRQPVSPAISGWNYDTDYVEVACFFIIQKLKPLVKSIGGIVVSASIYMYICMYANMYICIYACMCDYIPMLNVFKYMWMYALCIVLMSVYHACMYVCILCVLHIHR